VVAVLFPACNWHMQALYPSCVVSVVLQVVTIHNRTLCLLLATCAANRYCWQLTALSCLLSRWQLGIHLQPPQVWAMPSFTLTTHIACMGLYGLSVVAEGCGISPVVIAS
jgi:hypothetical protein